MMKNMTPLWEVFIRPRDGAAASVGVTMTKDMTPLWEVFIRPRNGLRQVSVLR